LNRQHWRSPHNLVVLAAIAAFTGISANAVVGKLLTPREVDASMQSALAGNGQSANALSKHFSIDGSTAESAYWFRVAIENGDPAALQEYSAKLWMSGGQRNCARAKFLLTRAISALGKAKGDAELRREFLAQQLDMERNFSKCASQRCNAMIEGASCN
jgi:hypothetical protein